MIGLTQKTVQRPCNAGSTVGATRGATLGQPPVNGGVQLSPYTPDVAPRLAGGGTLKKPADLLPRLEPFSGPFSRVPNTGNSRPVSQNTSAFRQTSGLGCSCCRLRWSSQVCGLAAAMKGTDHTFSAASLRLRRSLPKTRKQRMKDFHSPLALIGQATKQNRVHVVAASLALLIREMKVAETPDAIAFKSLAEAPDKIDAALARGPEALVFYKITSGEVRGIVTEQGDRLEAFAQSANADGASVLCFNPSLIATLASMIEPRVNDLIEAISKGFPHDA